MSHSGGDGVQWDPRLDKAAGGKRGGVAHLRLDHLKVLDTLFILQIELDLFRKIAGY
jgi:hypothetical protein